MKLGIIGAGGSGSFFIRNLSECIRKDLKGFDTLDPTEIEVIDNETVEEKNIAYTIYDVENMGRAKVEVISELYGFKGLKKEIKAGEELKQYDFLILCVDNNILRRLAFNTQISFLDLRSKGRYLVTFLISDFSSEEAQHYLKFTPANNQRDSCQYEEDIQEKSIQFGNRLVADIGLQLLKDYLCNEVFNKKYILQI